MMFALGAASSLLDSLQALTSSKSSSSTTSTTQTQGQEQASVNPFDLSAGSQASGNTSSVFSPGTSRFSSISPETMSALLDAQSQSGATSSTPTDPSDALKDLFSQIDGDGNGSINKSEFENALGAGGTNTAAADKVFGDLDANGDGSVSLDEMKSALQGAGGHHHGGHHHMHASGSSSDPSSTDSSTDPNATDPLAALQQGGPTSLGDLLKAVDKSSLQSISASGSASSSYNMIQQALSRAEQSFANSISSSLSVNV
jgi:EF-hand domain pair